MNEDFAVLRRVFSRLDREVEPGQELWGAIEAQIREGGAPLSAPRRRIGLLWALAASVGGLALGVALTLATLAAREAPHLANAPVPSYGFLPASTDAVRVKLRRDAEAALARLPPATRVHVQTDLARIHQALTDLERELSQDPRNTLLQDLLLSTYQDELDTLVNVQALARPVPTEI